MQQEYKPTKIDRKEYNYVVKKLREFFHKKQFEECHPQSRVSILAACEQPETMGTFNWGGKVWPLPQTGQMWLEYELMEDYALHKKNPKHKLTKGMFCITTSYRNEPDPIPGRHDLIFPMFEFETYGGEEDLRKLESELLEFLGFGPVSQHKTIDYVAAMEKYGVKEIEHEEEQKMGKEYGPVVLLREFPLHTSPFWNMKETADGKATHKVDVLVYGIETIGSAERETDIESMRTRFYNISDGTYAKRLQSEFGKHRVEAELEHYFKLAMVKRCGGGIGLTRLIRGMRLHGLLDHLHAA